MYPLGIVEGFNVLEHAQSNVLQSGVFLVIRPFMLERPEESLHDGVIIAAARAAHRAFDSKKLELRLISIAGVLATTVAVMQ